MNLMYAKNGVGKDTAQSMQISWFITAGSHVVHVVLDQVISTILIQLPTYSMDWNNSSPYVY